jgi:hypothetical protein
MNTTQLMKTICLLLCLFFIGPAVPGAGASSGNVNPALIYWQALMELPDLSPSEQALFDGFREAPLDDDYEALAHRYDPALRLVAKAANLKNSRCDWGIDLDDGPDTLLPHLARAKTLSRAAQMRARFFLQQNNETQVISDLAGTFVLGRRLATDGILISALVQIAVESIVVQTVAENFHQFTDLGVVALVAAFDAAPPRETIGRALSYGERTLVAWYAKKINEIRGKHQNESAALAEIRELLAEKTAETKDYHKADEFLKAAGGKIEGLIAHVRATDALYDEMERITKLDYKDFVRVNQEFFEKIETSSNPFVMTFFPALKKPQEKEFLVRSRIEKVRAAVQYRLHGERAVVAIRDPMGGGPFRVRRVSFEGQERGFEIASTQPADSPDRMIFIEKAGKPIHVIGIHAGEALTKR